MRTNYFCVLTCLVITILLCACKKEKDEEDPQGLNLGQINHFPLSSGNYWLYDYSENSSYYEAYTSKDGIEDNKENYTDAYQEFNYILEPTEQLFSFGKKEVYPLGTIYNDENNFVPKNEYELSDFEDLEYYEITEEGIYGRALESGGELIEMADYLMIKSPIEIGLEWTSIPKFDVDWMFEDTEEFAFSDIKSNAVVNSKYIGTIDVTFNNSSFEAMVLLEESTWQASANIKYTTGVNGVFTLQDDYTTKYYLISDVGIFKDESQWESKSVIDAYYNGETFGYESTDNGNSTTQLIEHNLNEKSKQKLDGIYVPALCKSKFNVKHRLELKAKMAKHLNRFTTLN